MRKLACLLAVGMLAGCSHTATPGSVSNEATTAPSTFTDKMPATDTTSQGKYKVHTLASGRSFIVHVPADYRPEEPLPVLLGLHGYKLDARNMFNSTNLHKARAITIFTQGEGKAWAPAPYALTSVEEDLAYIDGIVNFARQEYATTGEVYAVGFSNGGGFTRVLACQRPHTFDGLAAVSAANYDSVEKDCSNHPTPFLDIHGTEDVVMGYSGGTQHAAHYESARAAMDNTARANGCNPFPKRERIGNVDRYTWRVCDAATQHYRVDGGTHTWNGGSTDDHGLVDKDWATDTILEFFGLPFAQ